MRLAVDTKNKTILFIVLPDPAEPADEHAEPEFTLRKPGQHVMS